MVFGRICNGAVMGSATHRLSGGSRPLPVRSPRVPPSSSTWCSRHADRTSVERVQPHPYGGGLCNARWFHVKRWDRPRERRTCDNTIQRCTGMRQATDGPLSGHAVTEVYATAAELSPTTFETAVSRPAGFRIRHFDVSFAARPLRGYP